MTFEFSDGWTLKYQQRPGGMPFFSAQHTHKAVHNVGGGWLEINVMAFYHENTTCDRCGDKPPDAMKGTARLIEWSMTDDKA